MYSRSNIQLPVKGLAVETAAEKVRYNIYAISAPALLLEHMYQYLRPSCAFMRSARNTELNISAE